MELYDKVYFKKNKVFRKCSYLLISVIFFYAWTMLSSRYFLPIKITGIVFTIAAVVTPFLLLISIIQYHNSTAYTVVLGIFYFSILVVLTSLWNYVGLYQLQLSGDFIDYCSCSPPHEIKGKLKLICAIALAILVMSNNLVQAKFNIERWKWIGILLGSCFIYLITYIL